MGLSYRRRVNLGGGASANISKSGISFSQRTSWGSVSSRGINFRTGIPGLSMRLPFRSKKKDAGVMALVMLMIAGAIAAVYAAYYTVLALSWLTLKLFEWGKTAYYFARAEWLKRQSDKHPYAAIFYDKSDYGNLNVLPEDKTRYLFYEQKFRAWLFDELTTSEPILTGQRLTYTYYLETGEFAITGFDDPAKADKVMTYLTIYATQYATQAF